MRLYVVSSDALIDLYRNGERVRDYTRRRIHIMSVCTGTEAAKDTCRRLLNEQIAEMRNSGIDYRVMEDGDIDGCYARYPGTCGWVGMTTHDRDLRSVRWRWTEYDANKLDKSIIMDGDTWTPEDG